MNILRWSRPSVQIIKISSRNLHQVWTWKGALERALISKMPRKRLANEGAILVPMAVPWTWRWTWWLRPDLKNYIFGPEIGSGFGEPSCTPPPQEFRGVLPSPRGRRQQSWNILSICSQCPDRIFFILRLGIYVNSLNHQNSHIKKFKTGNQPSMAVLKLRHGIRLRLGWI